METDFIFGWRIYSGRCKTVYAIRKSTSKGPFQTLFLKNLKSLNFEIWTTPLDSAWKMTQKTLKPKSREVTWPFDFFISRFQTLTRSIVNTVTVNQILIMASERGPWVVVRVKISDCGDYVTWHYYVISIFRIFEFLELKINESWHVTPCSIEFFERISNLCLVLSNSVKLSVKCTSNRVLQVGYCKNPPRSMNHDLWPLVRLHFLRRFRICA